VQPLGVDDGNAAPADLDETGILQRALDEIDRRALTRSCLAADDGGLGGHAWPVLARTEMMQERGK
jgi:hypothetical protein